MTLVNSEQDGRVTLTPAGYAEIASSPLYNDDLGPVPLKERTWTTYNFAALWVGMAHSIPVYMLAAGLVALGMGWQQAILTIFIGNVVVLLPILANSHSGTKFGIPFPVYARASFGVLGANFPAVLRGLIACGWFGIQTWIGGEAIYVVAAQLFGDGWKDAADISGHPWTLWLSFAVFWALNIAIILRGMTAVRRFESWAAPAVLVVVVLLLLWMLFRAHGLGPLLEEGSDLGWGADFWKVFFPSLMGMIAFNATLSLNIPDFTRYGGSQRSQVLGQAVAIPTTMTIFPLMAVIITSGSVAVYGVPIWDPVQLMAKFSNPVVIIFGLLSLTVATLSVNVAANVVSPANDFSNVAPTLISFRTGGIITGVIAVLIQPWRLLESPETYVMTWLGSTGGLLGAIGGVLIADYWIVRRADLDLPGLYRRGGAYEFARGWNWRAVAATIAAGTLSVGGAYSNPGQGPFPVDGFLPFLKPLYDYGWFVGILGGAFGYVILTRLVPARTVVCQPNPVSVNQPSDQPDADPEVVTT
ncbi:NCS1 family nucleobase:cation symporter-1 [Rhodococcus sp. T7]|uniref:NCS1 family nucleobase:cation symporter-1 n=1 Tax=Rhodococcus sp. T7 TaxID=627444 RepID=UPI00135CB1DD|nr:NCS1 family nucleobase:cation symporter-1 [Rhodococcus sp. T7]KAF0964726.1 putative allantoin permease [Rhodococcus sp. T7]